MAVYLNIHAADISYLYIIPSRVESPVASKFPIGQDPLILPLVEKHGNHQVPTSNTLAYAAEWIA